MVKIRKAYTKNFTIVDNNVLDDSILSLGAKGLFTYLWRQPDDWEYYESEIIKHSKDSRDKVRGYLRELEKWGYLRRKQLKRKNGQFGKTFWELTEHPDVQEMSRKPDMNDFSPLTENPSTGKPSTENPATEKPLTENPILLSTNYTNTNNTKYDDDNNAAGYSNLNGIEILTSIGAAPNMIQRDKYLRYQKEYGEQFLKAVAIRVGELKSNPDFGYFEGAVKNFIRDGVTTPEGIKKATKKHEQIKDDLRKRKEKYMKTAYSHGTKMEATGAVDFLDPRRLDEM